MLLRAFWLPFAVMLLVMNDTLQRDTQMYEEEIKYVRSPSGAVESRKLAVHYLTFAGARSR